MLNDHGVPDEPPMSGDELDRHWLEFTRHTGLDRRSAAARVAASSPAAVSLAQASAPSAAVSSAEHEAVVIPIRRPVAAPKIARVAPKPSRWRTVGIAAAATLCIVGAGMAVRFYTAQSREESLTQETAYRTYTAPKGQQMRLTLPDSTQVILASQTTLRVPRTWSDTRDVHLAGEAYFEVVPAQRPFIVHANNAVTRVLGTAFGVRAYPDDANVRVAVATGKVAVQSVAAAGATPRKPVVVSAGSVARLSIDGETSVQHDPEISRYVAWVNGDLVFENTPMARVAEELGRWFDVQVDVKDKALLDRTLTGRYRHSSLETVLASMQQSLGSRYERHGRTVALYDARRVYEPPPPRLYRVPGTEADRERERLEDIRDSIYSLRLAR